jgi:hypothetical protein
MTLKSLVLSCAVILAGILAYSAAHPVAASAAATSRGQRATATSQKSNSNNQNSSASSKKAAPLDCSCTGTGCSCSCSGPGCVCGCDGGNCSCKNFKAITISLKFGTTINEIAKSVSIFAFAFLGHRHEFRLKSLARFGVPFCGSRIYQGQLQDARMAGIVPESDVGSSGILRGLIRHGTAAVVILFRSG